MSDSRPKVHAFICTNKKEGSTCSQKNAAALRTRLKDKCKNAQDPWKGQVQVTASGCLGHCQRGINAVVYPQGVWLHELEDTDDQKIIDVVDECLKQK